MPSFRCGCSYARIAAAVALAATAPSLTRAQSLTFTVHKTGSSGFNENFVRGVYANGNNVYTANEGGGVSISTNGGSTWTSRTSNGLGTNFVYGIVADGGKIYAGTTGGLSISTDGGGGGA
jgi:hypothetical protein